MSEHPIVLFDGVCNFCHGTVRFLIRRDKTKRFKFASLQSDTGRALVKQHGLPDDLRSMILVEGDQAWQRSTASLRVVRGLRWPWPVLYGFIVVPRFLRDGVYDWVARNRYRWFGKKEACALPDEPDWEDRFIQ